MCPIADLTSLPGFRAPRPLDNQYLARVSLNAQVPYRPIATTAPAPGGVATVTTIAVPTRTTKHCFDPASGRVPSGVLAASHREVRIRSHEHRDRLCRVPGSELA